MSEPNTPSRTVTILDACLVMAVVVIMSGLMGVLAFVHVPQENLPILAGMGATLLSVITGYVGYRWGASEASKRAAPSPLPPPAPPAVSDAA